MQKRAVSKSIKAYSLAEICLLICMTFAVAFLLGNEIKTVSAEATLTNPPLSLPAGSILKSSNGQTLTVKSYDYSTGISFVEGGTLKVTDLSTLQSKGWSIVSQPQIAPSATPTPVGTPERRNSGGSSGLDALALATGKSATPDFSSFFSSGTSTGTITVANNQIAVAMKAAADGTVYAVNEANGQVYSVSNNVGTAIGGTAYSGGSLFGQFQTTSWGMGNLLSGITHAVVAAGIAGAIAALLGANSQQAAAASKAAAIGAASYNLINYLFAKGPPGNQGIAGSYLTPGWAGAAAAVIGIAVFIATYKQEKQQLVSFQCLPWEPPLGGNNCEQCNSDPFRPCTEYRCRSLGQACQLLNSGTGKETCAWVNPKDVTSPTITQWDAALKPSGLIFTPDPAVRPGARGVKIVAGTADGCLPAFTHLQFGVLTNEPAQCKIDYNRTNSFGNMSYYFGGSNYYGYNHTQIMSLPSPNSADTNLAPLLLNDGSFSLYVRCMDANGNANVDEYSINFCVQTGPDTTPPIIEGTSITDGSSVQSGINTVPIEVYVNEPAICKWSKQDREFDSMENVMNCATQTNQVNANLQYTCSGNLTGVADQQNNSFFFRCKDQPLAPDAVRNVMLQSYPLSLIGTEPLSILNVGPNSTVIASTTSVPVSLNVETGFGADNGKATCRFSSTGAEGSYVDMYNTNAAFHTQPLSLTSGNYTYYIRCLDSGGNLVNSSTTFSVSVDSQAPVVTRVYKEDPDLLKIITNENAQCVYSINSCNYDFKDGLQFNYPDSASQLVETTAWKTNTPYYIKCRDAYGNEPNPSSCSIIATGLDLGIKAKTSG